MSEPSGAAQPLPQPGTTGPQLSHGSRPGVVRALMAVLAVQALTGFILVGYGATITVAALVADDGWGDLVRTIGLVIVGAALLVSVLLGLAWWKVMRRKRSGVMLTLTSEAVVIAMGVAVAVVGGRGLVPMAVLLALVAGLGIVLALNSTVRAWLA